MTSVYALLHEVDHEGDTLLGVFSTLDDAIEIARSVRKRRSGGRWVVSEAELGSTSAPEQVWGTKFVEGPSSDGKYGWYEIDGAGEVIHHVRTPEGYLYPGGFDG